MNGLQRPLAAGVAAVALGAGFVEPVATLPSANAGTPAARNTRFGVPATDDWWARVREGLARAEYHATETARGLQAPNRAHNLRTYFDSVGIRVHPRTTPAGPDVAPPGPDVLRLSLVGLGRSDALRPVPEGTVTHAGARVEIRRPGLVEWYENAPRGLEQGFTLEERPAGDGPLTLDLALDGARAALDDDSVVFTTEDGRSLRYGALRAWDATGRPLVSTMRVPSPRRVRLGVDDREAMYPVTIDPLLTGTPDAMLESNQPDPPGFLPDAFGGSVAPAGDVNGDGFADVIVGAPGWDGGDPHEGAAFVFLGSPSGIVGSDPSSAHARIESNQFGAQLGTLPRTVVGDVNGDGYDDIVVGAHFYESVLPGTQLEVNGAAFVFHGGPAGITGTDPTNADATILANELVSDLGVFLSGAGDVNNDGFADVIVGVPGHGTPFPPEIPPNQRSGDHGAALVFHGSPAGITGTGFDDADAVLLSYEDTGQPDPTIYGKIGSVSGAGDVNGDGFDDVVLGGSQVALFLGSAGGIVGHDLTDAQSTVEPGGPFGFSAFSLHAAAAGDVNADGFADVIAGAPTREVEPFTAREEGAAFVFLGGPAGLTATDTNQADASFVGTLLAEWVGAGVAGAGDVDNDGFDDILISAREYPGSLTSEGVAYLFRGGPSGIVAESLLDADARLEARQSGAVVLGNNAAFAIAGAGDINADGFDDVIMGKGYWDNGEENEGAAFIYLGQAWPANPNKPPVADAGVDQLIFDYDNDGTANATLFGCASFDPDGVLTGFAWLEGETLLGTSGELTTSLTATGDHTLVLTATDDSGVTRGDPVTVRVEPLPSSQVLFDSFSAGLGAWSVAGDVALSSADSFPTPPQLRLGASGALAQRSIALPAGTTGITLSFWAKGSGFAPSDLAHARVSVDGGPFTTLMTITSAEADGAYQFYGGSLIPIGISWFPATASSVVLEFESEMTTGALFVDDVNVRALIGPPDQDTDGDGTPDDLDGCPLDPNKTDPGVCGCGSPDVDVDADGAVDCGYDACNPPAQACVGDIDGDGGTDVFDFTMLVGHFGDSVPPNTLGDLDGSSFVDVFDFALFGADFGCAP